MIAEQPKSPPGLPLTINFKIPADWRPEQALAVFELSRQQHLHARTDPDNSKVDDQSF